MRKLAPLVAAGLLTVALSSCSAIDELTGDDPIGGNTPDPTAQASDAPEPTPPANSTDPSFEAPAPSEAPASSDAPSSSALTPPGTKLSVGDWATVPYNYTSESQGVLRVRLTEIATPPASELDAFDSSTRSKLAGYTPKYLHWEIQAVSGTNLAHTSPTSHLEAITVDNKRAAELNPYSTFTPCNPDSFPAGFGVGSSATTCTIALVGNGSAEIAGGMYTQTDSAYSQYDGRPIIWS